MLALLSHVKAAKRLSRRHGAESDDENNEFRLTRATLSKPHEHLCSKQKVGTGSGVLAEKRLELDTCKTLLCANLILSEAENSQIASRLMSSIGLDSATPNRTDVERGLIMSVGAAANGSVFDTGTQIYQRGLKTPSLLGEESSYDGWHDDSPGNKFHKTS